MNTKDWNEFVTAEVVRALEKGVAPWKMPWVVSGTATPDPRVMPVSYATGRCYSVVNQWLIMLSGHGAGEYATFNQIKECGGAVKKGEHGATVFFFKTLKPVPVKDANGNVQVDDDGRVVTFTPWVARAYKVFNTYTQCEGISAKWRERAEEAERERLNGRAPVPVIEAAQNALDAYLTRSGVTLRHGGEQAFYSGADDAITLPYKDAFVSANGYYKTAFHECAHSTGVKSRLNRKMGGVFGSYDYGREELVAEMAASMLCGGVGIDPLIEDTAAYCKSWLKVCREDSGAITYAAKQAAKAAAYFNGEAADAGIGEGEEVKAA